MIVLMAGLASASWADADVAPMKIGTVDMQKALQSVEAGKKARSQLESEFNKKKVELQKEEADIKKMHEEFQKQSLVMNEQARGKKQSELQQRILKLQEQTAKSQMEIQKKEQDLTTPILTKLRDVIKKIAEKKGYTVVLEKNENSVLYSLEKDDLTTEVVSSYNQEK
jgi:outer membrane protein